MARKSRYMGYIRGLQKLGDSKKGKSTKESIMAKMNSLKGKEFHMTIPVSEGEKDAQ